MKWNKKAMIPIWVVMLIAIYVLGAIITFAVVRGGDYVFLRTIFWFIYWIDVLSGASNVA